MGKKRKNEQVQMPSWYNPDSRESIFSQMQKPIFDRNNAEWKAEEENRLRIEQELLKQTSENNKFILNYYVVNLFKKDFDLNEDEIEANKNNIEEAFKEVKEKYNNLLREESYDYCQILTYLTYEKLKDKVFGEDFINKEKINIFGQNFPDKIIYDINSKEVKNIKLIQKDNNEQIILLNRDNAVNYYQKIIIFSIIIVIVFFVSLFIVKRKRKTKKLGN